MIASSYFVYIIQCAGGSLYTGITTDVARRFAEHQAGTAARYTRSHKPIKIVYQEQCVSRSAALKREREIKKLPRWQKMRLLTKT